MKDIKSAGASLGISAYDYNAKVVPVTSYQAQLIPLNKSYFFMERAALHAVLHAPFNTFRHSDFFKLHDIGGPKIRSLNVACAAALYRTAAKTNTGWPEWLRQLKTVAEEHLPVANLRDDRQCPSFWDTPSIAQNLQRAVQGFTNDPKFGQAGAAVLHKFKDENNGVLPSLGSIFSRGKKYLRKIVHEIMM